MCSPRTNPARRGAALLLVLAVLVIAVTSATVLVSVAAAHRARMESLQTTASADQLLRAIEPALQAWLADAESTVLPIDAMTPASPVLDDTWTLGEIAYRIRVTAFDQCGMLPHNLAASPSPLRRSVDPAALDAAQDLERTKQSAPGLDQITEAIVAVFPSHAPDRLSVGALIATHPTGSINVNTAPWPLVEATARALGQSGSLGLIEEARLAGKPATFSARGSRDALKKTPTLISSSASWSMRIDIAVGPVNQSRLRRSWWAIYQRRGGQWSCTQRLAIDR